MFLRLETLQLTLLSKKILSNCSRQLVTPINLTRIFFDKLSNIQDWEWTHKAKNCLLCESFSPLWNIWTLCSSVFTKIPPFQHESSQRIYSEFRPASHRSWADFRFTFYRMNSRSELFCLTHCVESFQYVIKNRQIVVCKRFRRICICLTNFNNQKPANSSKVLPRVSVQGVESLWGECRFIPADWGSQ